MGLILLICSLFLPVSVSHVIVCLSIDSPLYWFGLDLLFTTAFSVYVGFLAKSHVHTRIFGQKSRIYAAIFYTVAYILPCGEFDVVGSCWMGCECG